MSQVAAMLNYGKMQILENFKNTLPYQLYSTLIYVNNLRDAIDLAKRVLMKEKLDRQLTGQNTQHMFRNRGQSRDRAGNYNNDYTRGRSRDRNNDRPIQSRQSILSHGRDESISRSNSRVGTNHDCVRCCRCREYDHFASECPNTPTDDEPDCDNADPASLQMMTQDYYPIDSEG